MYYPHHSDPEHELINLEDHDSHTPILTAAARSKVKAFQCLMKYQHHLKENPVFKALESEENPVAILKVFDFLEVPQPTTCLLVIPLLPTNSKYDAKPPQHMYIIFCSQKLDGPCIHAKRSSLGIHTVLEMPPTLP